METRIIFIRHGETEWNEKRIMQSITDVPLSKKGVKQANSLAKRLKDEKIDVIYSSPLSRALKTAGVIGKLKKLKVSNSDSLKERNFGIWEGRKAKDILSKYGNREITIRPRNGESYADVEKRIIPFIEKLLSKHKGKTILLSGHGSMTRILMGHYLKVPLKYRFRIKISNASLSIVTFNKGNPRVSVVNEHNHVK